MSLGLLDGHTDTPVRGSRSVVDCYASSTFLAPLRDARFVLPFVYVLIIRVGTLSLCSLENSCSIYHTSLRPGRPPYSHSLISFRFILGGRQTFGLQKTDLILYIDFIFLLFFFSCKTTVFFFLAGFISTFPYTNWTMMYALARAAHAKLIK